MTPEQERYQRAQKIVESALEREPAQRPDYLAQACTGDGALRDEVESLLKADGLADSFLDVPAPAKYAYVLESKDEEPTIFKGRYATERKLNQGGFGVLYLACDLDLYSRLVAVKVIRSQTGKGSVQLNEYLKRKFREEIDALTRFRHPHIVNILDQGELPDGAPFLVMDFIEGISLREVMQGQKLGYQIARDFTEALASALTGQPQTLHSALANETTAPESGQYTTVPDTPLIREVRPAEVVISYSTEDIGHALRVAEQLKAAGVACWLADHGREAVLNDRSETIRAIRECKAVLLLCSDAALRAASIKQDLQMAWSYEQPFLPLLIEPIDFAEQSAYWLEGKQWIEAMDAPPERWLPQVLQSLARVGVHFHDTEQPTLPAGQLIQPIRLNHSLQSLRAIARFTDQIWPLPAERVPRSVARSAARGLGAPQEDVLHGHRLGSRVCLAIESDRAGHLLLLDEGPEEIIYCLCPSWFAPDTRLPLGRSYLPQAGSRYDSFMVMGKAGREHLLAIVSDDLSRTEHTVAREASETSSNT